MRICLSICFVYLPLEENASLRDTTAHEEHKLYLSFQLTIFLRD